MNVRWQELLRLIPSSTNPLQTLRSILVELDGQVSIRPDSAAFGQILQACRRLKAVAEGKRTQEHIEKSGLDGNLFLGNHLIAMYARCGSLEEASAVFGKLRERNLFSYSAMIDAFLQTGHCQEAFDALKRMRVENIKVDNVLYSILLRKCESLEIGNVVHGEATRDGMDRDALVAAALVRMYAHYGKMREARKAFDSVRESNVFLWNAMFSAYAQNGQMHDILVMDLFRRMMHSGQKPDGFTLSSVLNSCTNLSWGKMLHTWILENDEFCDIILETSLLNMYVRVGNLEMAWDVFNGMAERDVVTWTTLISQYQGDEAFWHLRSMQLEGVSPDKITFIHVVNACSTLGQVISFHKDVKARGFESDVTLGNALLNMYGKFGDWEMCLEVFDGLCEKDVSSWNSLMGAFAEHAHGKEAILVFYAMIQEGEVPDDISFANVLKSCVFLDHGKVIHACIAEMFDLCNEVVLATSLVDMYGKCGDVENARKVFEGVCKEDVVLWNAMIGACSNDSSALELFKHMDLMGLTNGVTVVPLLNSLVSLEQVRMVHRHVLQSNVGHLDIILENALLNAYSKFWGLEDAQALFDAMPRPNLSSYNAIISAYAQVGHSTQVSKLFRCIDHEGFKPTGNTFIKLIDTFSVKGSLDLGTNLHTRFLESGYEIDGCVGSSLANFYSKCGNMEECQKIFRQMQKRDAVSWTIMVVAFAQTGEATKCLKAFNCMQQEGLKPNYVTFIGLLSACSHAGLIDEGCRYFDSMSKYHGVEPGAAHYGCMVDLLGRAGRIDEAEELILKSPYGSNLDSWGSFLAACSNHGETTRSKRASKKMLEMDPQSAAPYINLFRENLNPAGL